MFYSRILYSSLNIANTSEKAAFSGGILREIIAKAMGKPTSSDELCYFKRMRKHKNAAPCFLGELRPKLRLIATASDSPAFPKPQLPEVAFYGRTNSGKSCMINALCGRFGACTVKDNPGTTRQIHFFKAGSPPTLVLVDLPGYGYSTASECASLNWNELTLSYIKHRRNLRLVVILADSRVGVKVSDLEVINFCSKYKVRWQLVLSKCDFVKPVELAKSRLLVANFKHSCSLAFAASATKDQNLNELRAIIDPFRVDKATARNIGKNQNQHNLDTPSVSTNKSKGTIPSSQGRKPKRLDQSKIESRPLPGFNLRRHLLPPKDPSSVEHVAIESLCDVFDRLEPPADFVDTLQEVSGASVAELPANFLLPNISESIVPYSIQVDGCMMCSVDIDANATGNDDHVIPKSEKLIHEKVVSFQRKLESGILGSTAIERPKLGASYKRVLSLFKTKRGRKVDAPPKPNKDIQNWTRIHAKWQRWSRKHLQLAASITPPTKARIYKESRVRKTQHKLYRERLQRQREENA